MTEPVGDSYVRRFLFEDLEIRGAVARLGDVWRRMQHGRAYPPALAKVLGQVAAVTAVIAGNLKQPGRLTFQLQGHGPIELLVVDCDASLNIRGHARAQDFDPALPPARLFADGRLMLTLDVAGLDRPYQSFVPIEGDSVAAMFSHYLARSEQQQTGLWLAADGDSASCLFVQKLPGADPHDADGWSRVHQLASTVTDDELLGLDCEDLLRRLFHEETVRLFAARPLRHDWPRDRERIADVLRGLGREEIERIIAEQGEARIQDELSNHEYVFDADELRVLIDHPPTLQ